MDRRYTPYSNYLPAMENASHTVVELDPGTFLKQDHTIRLRPQYHFMCKVRYENETRKKELEQSINMLNKNYDKMQTTKGRFVIRQLLLQ